MLVLTEAAGSEGWRLSAAYLLDACASGQPRPSQPTSLWAAGSAAWRAWSPRGPGPEVSMALTARCSRRRVWEAEDLGHHAEGAPAEV